MRVAIELPKIDEIQIQIIGAWWLLLLALANQMQTFNGGYFHPRKSLVQIERYLAGLIGTDEIEDEEIVGFAAKRATPSYYLTGDLGQAAQLENFFFLSRMDIIIANCNKLRGDEVGMTVEEELVKKNMSKQAKIGSYGILVKLIENHQGGLENLWGFYRLWATTPMGYDSVDFIVSNNPIKSSNSSSLINNRPHISWLQNICRIKVYAPFKDYRSECPKILVVVKGVHPHPIPLPTKTPPAIKHEILQLLPRF
ncbi:hypothetical protein B0H11DRAFT_1923084 [Mycena galericulata]|nr:hypothetical protein B0H11DRAFT_1923084 [Mycena galericulata]